MVAAIFIPRPVIHRIDVPICAPGDLHPYHLCIRAEDVPVPQHVDLSTGLMLALGFAFVGLLLGVAPWHTRSPEARLRDDRGERLCALLALVFAASGFVGTAFFAPESFTRPVYTLLFLAAWAVTLMTRTESPTR